MKKLAVLLVALLIASAVTAQPKKKPNPFKSKQFWISTAAIVTVALVDAHSTNRIYSYCNRHAIGPSWCPKEMNPLLGSRPSAKRVYLTGGGIIAAERLIVAAIWRKHEKAGRAIDLATVAGHAAFNLSFAAENRKNLEWLKSVCPANGSGCSK